MTDTTTPGAGEGEETYQQTIARLRDEVARLERKDLSNDDMFLSLHDAISEQAQTIAELRKALEEARKESSRGNSSAKLTLRTVQLMLDKALAAVAATEAPHVQE